MTRRRSAMAAILVLSLTTGFAHGVAAAADGASPWAAVVSPNNSFDTLFAKDGKVVLTAQMVGWGPNWAWAGSPSSHDKAVDGELNIHGSLSNLRTAGAGGMPGTVKAAREPSPTSTN